MVNRHIPEPSGTRKELTMSKGMLGDNSTLRQLMGGPITELLTHLNGKNGKLWEAELRRFLRKDPTWVATRIMKGLAWQTLEYGKARDARHVCDIDVLQYVSPEVVRKIRQTRAEDLFELSGQREAHVAVAEFDRSESLYVIEDMKRLGLGRPTVLDALLYCSAPGLHRPGTTIFLHEPWQDMSKTELVLALQVNPNNKARSLVSRMFDGVPPENTCFLVKKPASD